MNCASISPTTGRKNWCNVDHDIIKKDQKYSFSNPLIIVSRGIVARKLFSQFFEKRRQTTIKGSLMQRVSHPNYPSSCFSYIGDRELMRCLTNRNNGGQLQLVSDGAMSETAIWRKFLKLQEHGGDNNRHATNIENVLGYSEARSSVIDCVRRLRQNILERCMQDGKTNAGLKLKNKTEKPAKKNWCNY